jgi:hypothetical protein
MKELEDCLREALEESPYGIVTNDTALETARKYASELLRQRDELREALADMVSQFAYRGTYEGRENLHTGGLSALEDAFVALGLSDPITVYERS